MSATEPAAAPLITEIDFLEETRRATAEPKDDNASELRRTLEICNACRYCEGYCDVFPAMTMRRAFSDADLSYLANLCHNCRGCYYACQYAPPHDFALNLPRALAVERVDSWRRYARPRALAALMEANGLVVSIALALGVAAMMAAAAQIGGAAGERSFYAVLPHDVMVAIFAPLFLFALAAMAWSVLAFWRDTAPSAPTTPQLAQAVGDGLRLKNLGGGHGEGCNFEKGETYSNARRYAHHAVFWGFMLCFASTASGTVLHYAFDAPAPYNFWSLPKLLGVPGGILLCLGIIELARQKRKADPDLGALARGGMETAFLALLFWVSLSGLLLFALRETSWMAPTLYLHLGAVAAFFLTLPFTKMVHGLYRLAALARRAQERT